MDEKLEAKDDTNVGNPPADVTTEASVTASQETQKAGKTETPEQLEQKERSNLGRKVKKLEDTLEQMNEAIQEMRSQRQAPQTAQEDLPEYISTPGDVEKYLTLRERKQKEERDRYQSVYAKTFREVGKEDPEMYEEIFNEMFEHFNVVKTGQAEVDAELNYARAKASVFAKKTSQPKPKANVKGKEPAGSTNLSVDSRAETTSGPEIELDDYAKEFMAKTGMKPESVKDALKGEIPIHLRK
jgi:hypothetical protein